VSPQKIISLLLLSTLPCFSPALRAGAAEAVSADPVERGTAIAREAERRDSGFGDSEETLTMVLRDNKGRERSRTLRLRTLEQADDGDWSLTIFDEPADVKGTALLTYSHGLEADDQWIYLPALKRVKRISSKNKSGPFMGSELAFEDLSSFELEKYRYRYLRDEPCEALQCFVSEWVPAYEHSGYSRMEVWHDTREYRLQRIDYYDRKGQHLKTLSLKEYQMFDERFWRALHWEMRNHKTGKVTLLDFTSIEFGQGFTERDFDQNSLKRAR
jgi:outer membrane lipoprotein-sorting protein